MCLWRYIILLEKTEKSGLAYDADKQIFITRLIEDSSMKKYYPEEMEGSEKNKEAWNVKWDGYRLEMSKVFSELVAKKLLM